MLQGGAGGAEPDCQYGRTVAALNRRNFRLLIDTEAITSDIAPISP